MAAAQPKQYLELAPGLSVLDACIKSLLRSQLADELLVVLAQDDTGFADSNYASQGNVHSITGGSTRAQSVANAAEYACEHYGDNYWLWVHDAARPLITQLDLRALAADIEQYDCACALGAPINDSCYQIDAQGALKPKANLWRAFTPQVARAGQLRRALQQVGTDTSVRDELSALNACGQAVRLVNGSSNNLKLTTADDLALARALYKP